MRYLNTLILAVIFAFSAVMNVQAQSAESIWLASSTASYKTGETVIVTVNAASSTPVQGFTFQIRYDPACLTPVNAASSVPGMNALPLPQTAGLVDGSYASTTPQLVNGVLAEVRFSALGGCQTNLVLESAALAIRNESGFAAPLAGVALAERTVALTIDKEVSTVQNAQPPSGSILPLEPQAAPEKGFSGWLLGLLGLLAIAIMFGAFKLFRIGSGAPQKSSTTSKHAMLHMKHGPHAGKSFVLKKLPCSIGRDPVNEICLNDPHIMSQHAQISARSNGYYLTGLSGDTFINGHAIRNNSAVLKPGDVVRLGKSSLFVFVASQ